jgi:hypothetical protein
MAINMPMAFWPAILCPNAILSASLYEILGAISSHVYDNCLQTFRCTEIVYDPNEQQQTFVLGL